MSRTGHIGLPIIRHFVSRQRATNEFVEGSYGSREAIQSFHCQPGNIYASDSIFDPHSKCISLISLYCNSCHAISVRQLKFEMILKKDYNFNLMIVTAYTALICDGLSDKTVHTWTILVRDYCQTMEQEASQCSDRYGFQTT